MNEPGNPNNKGIEIKAFRPRALENGGSVEYAQVKKQFGSLANTDKDSNSHFTLNSAAKKLLGIEKEEHGHIEDLVQTEVAARIEKIEADAYQKGFAQGLSDGRQKTEAELREEMAPVMQNFLSILNMFEGMKQEMYAANEALIIQMILGVGKQVLLRELQTDVDYIKRLTAQVVDQTGVKDAIRIKVNAEDYKCADQVREFLKMQFPDLKNVQFEIADDLPLGGCKIESELTRINASIENQLASIRKAMETI